MKAVVAAFNQEKALVGAFSVIVQLHRLIDLRHYFRSSRDLDLTPDWLQVPSSSLVKQQIRHCPLPPPPRRGRGREKDQARGPLQRPPAGVAQGDNIFLPTLKYFLVKFQIFFRRLDAEKPPDISSSSSTISRHTARTVCPSPCGRRWSTPWTSSTSRTPPPSRRGNHEDDITFPNMMKIL